MTPELTHICLPIREELGKLEGELIAYLRSEVPLVQEVVRYVVQNGGKRVRPILSLLAARLCGVGSTLDVIPFASAIEYIHTASLLHDDVIDNAPLRRGKPSANAKWGNAVSVLVGDFFYCRASELLVQAGNLDILTLVSNAITRTTEGEVLEITKSNDLNVTEEDYLTIIYCKTAMLIGTACEIGACLGNLSAEFRLALRRFGENLGMAFQLADDILDYLSHDHQFGKENGTDLKEGKLTLPLIYTLKAASEAERQELRGILLAKELKSEDLKRVTVLMDRYGSSRKVMDKAQGYIAAAKEALDLFKPSIVKDSLLALTDYVIERTH